MKKIEELAQLFAKNRIYPACRYYDYTPVRIFQRVFPENPYSKDLTTFLSYQNYEPTQRGADLPFWGKEYFTDKKGIRVFVVGQDYQCSDAMSVVLFSHLFPIIDDEYGYSKYTREFTTLPPFPFNRWIRVKTQLTEWGIDFDFLYMTDASKIYKNGSWKHNDFDKQKSKELLEAEIEVCDPNLIILLGAPPLKLLDETKRYASVVEDGKLFPIKGRRCVVSPFFIGNGCSQPNFKERLEIATKLIKEELKK